MMVVVMEMNASIEKLAHTFLCSFVKVNVKLFINIDE